MTYFQYQNKELYAEQVPLQTLAEQFGTPCYVYSKAALTDAYQTFSKAFKETAHQICYAVKANSNIAVLQLLAQLGAGFDVVSEGELKRVLKAGGDPTKVVFSGIGKTESEINFGLSSHVGCFNIESEAELIRIAHIATTRQHIAPISFRVNPDVNPKTHPYIATGLKENKFGIPITQAIDLYKQAHQHPYLHIKGIACHIGSQLLELKPIEAAISHLLELHDQLNTLNIPIDHIDVGGGLGVRYRDEHPPSIEAYVETLISLLKQRQLCICLEPGRAIAANAGLLLTRADYLKPTSDKNFLIIDAAMNDLIRPSLYQAWQPILPCKEPQTQASQEWDIVGPVCETGDFLGKARSLNVKQGDLLAIMSAGAYGFTMSSNYNSRNRAAEVMVDQDKTYLIRARESFDDQIRLETLLPEQAII